MGTEEKEGQEAEAIRTGLTTEERRQMYYRQMEQKSRQKSLKKKRRRRKWRRFWQSRLPWILGAVLLLAVLAVLLVLVTRGCGGEYEKEVTQICFTGEDGSLYFGSREQTLVDGNHELLFYSPDYSRFLVLKDGALYYVSGGKETLIADKVDGKAVSADRDLKTVAYYQKNDLSYSLFLWNQETGKRQALEEGVEYLNTVRISRDGGQVAYAVQDSEGKNQIRVADVSSLQSEAVVGSEDYLSCYYAEGEELIYYSLADKRLIYRKGGQERTLGSDVQDVLVYPEDKIVVYRDAGENVYAGSYVKDEPISGLGGGIKALYIVGEEDSPMNPSGALEIREAARGEVVYGSAGKLLMKAGNALVEADILTGKVWPMANEAPDRVVYAGSGERVYYQTGTVLKETSRVEAGWTTGRVLTENCTEFAVVGKSFSAVWLEEKDLYTQGSEAKKLISDSVRRLEEGTSGRGMAYLQGTSLYFLEEAGADPVLLTDGADTALAPVTAGGKVFYRKQDKTLHQIDISGKNDKEIAANVTSYYAVWR